MGLLDRLNVSLERGPHSASIVPIEATGGTPSGQAQANMTSGVAFHLHYADGIG